MPGSLDRALQRQILEQLSGDYPQQSQIEPERQTPEFTANLHYLMEHGLVEAEFGRVQSHPIRDRSGKYEQPRYLASKVRITARGMDFLSDDGGLSAVLTIVNVRKADQ